MIYLGLRTLLSDDELELAASCGETNTRRAFYQGITTEILNPKTALFFLAFIPQFVNPHGMIVLQFIVLGCISVLLNTSADVVVATLAGPIGHRLRTSARLRHRQRIATGSALIGLGAYVAVTGKPQ